MSTKFSALVLRDTGMNNNETLESILPSNWKVDVLSIREDKADLAWKFLKRLT